MAWGGAGAASLGLDGEVGVEEWRAVFGTGGVRHPESAERLVHCLRPGMELVVSPHKSVAELGVIGRPEDMHAILDAERDATMAYLDDVVREEGGRRGRAQVRAPTDGLTWAVSRHATTRAGDPQVHDHVLVANIVKHGRRTGWLERARHRPAAGPPPRRHRCWPHGVGGQGGRARLPHRG